MVGFDILLYVGLIASIVFCIYCFTDLSDEYGKVDVKIWYKRIRWGENLFASILISVIIIAIHILLNI